MVSADGAEVDLDYRSEGGLIGYVTLSGAKQLPANVTAVEETVCYLVPRESFKTLLDSRPALREFFSRTFLSRYMDRAFSDLRRRSQGADFGEKPLFTTPVGNLAIRAVVTGPSDNTTRAAAQIMSSNQVSSLVLSDAGGNPVGIVTDRDLREKVAAAARDYGNPVAQIMSEKLLRADSRNSCFEALLSMIRNRVHHLLVEDQGRLRGIITNHDLTLFQGSSPRPQRKPTV